MDRNRRIVLSILVLIVLSCLLAIIDIGMNIQKKEKSTDVFKISAPEVGPGIGVIRIYGPIQISDGTGNVFGIRRGADGIVERLDEMGRDDMIKAIVVRINSPGGTVAATQEIFQKLIELKKMNIVLVASMGDVAASGGYYIASACNYIMANHGTITGSIGVIAASPNLKGLFEKIGIEMNVIKSGQYKDILAAYRDITPDERRLIQELIDSSYYKFLKDVSLGRNMAISDIRPHADGRVMNGESALKYKLIDGLGSYEMALDKARELAKLPPDCAVYDEDSNPMHRLLMSLEGIFRQKSGLERHLTKSKYTMIEYSLEP